ncbi:MAG: tol-pal system protein YbgF [Desulfobacteraceae bacterium]|nr:tol-pal system protein YbgF [Desulfobacteraceae bacterium]
MKYLVFLTLICSLLVPGCAMQRDIYIMENRLQAIERRNVELEKKNQNLRQQLATEAEKNQAVLQTKLKDLGQTRETEEQRIRSQYAGLNATLDSFSEDIKTLNGKIEESEYYFRQNMTTLEDSGKRQDEQLQLVLKSLSEFDKRIDQLEQYLNLERGKKPRAKSTNAVRSTSATPTAANENELYSTAKAAFDKNDFDGARSGFESLLQKYPKSANADNAQFWLGEIYFKEKWYEKAILEYQKVLDNYPRGNKVPAALLKQGLAFVEIGDKSSARLILKDLTSRYPNTSEGKIAVQKLEEI